jgi:hypothetical protein
MSQKDGYRRPKKTFQDTLTEKEIQEQLRDYQLVDDITQVPINTHIRYFVYDKESKQKKFRLGGNLTKIDPIKQYLVLSNGKTSWSVQFKNTTFFAKQSIDEIREYYEKKLHKYKKEVKKLKQSLEEIKKTIAKNNSKK